MKILYIHILLLFILCIPLNAQNTITGQINTLINNKIELRGFKGNTNYLIDSSITNINGDFNLKFTSYDYGLAYLLDNNNNTYYVVLADENIILQGSKIAQDGNIIIEKGKQSQLLQQFAIEYPLRNNTLSAWQYLERLYSNTTIVQTQKESLQVIQNEKKKIIATENIFFKNIDSKSYVSWYLPMRKLASSVATTLQNRSEEIPAMIEQFRKIDYADDRWYRSDLYYEIIERHFYLLENSGGTMDTIYKKMETSIDIILDNLASDEKKYNEIGNYLFGLLEQRSLFSASEYLALKLLNQKRCTLDENFANELEIYRKMRVGNIAPNIIFPTNILAPNYPYGQYPKNLKDIPSKYKLVLFGAGWCQSCIEDLPQIVAIYPKLKSNNVEVVFVSLDNTDESFKNFTTTFPFISICDYKSWEGDAAKSYFVSATPTMFILDNTNKILARPISVKHLEAWVDWYIEKGNSIPITD